jgi:hypothetical protein
LTLSIRIRARRVKKKTRQSGIVSAAEPSPGLLESLVKHPSVVAGLIAMAAAVACAASPHSGGADPAACGREPSGSVMVAIEGMQTPRYARSLAGTIVSVQPGTGGRPARITVRLVATEETVRILYRDPTGEVPLPPGRHFELEVESIGGYPGASALVASDDRGLAFAAASDGAPGRKVLRGGVEGFRMGFLPASCPGRPADRCYEALINRPLEFARGGETAVLMHGDRKTLDDYRIDCFTSQQVVYRKGCADAGLVGMSYRVVRSNLAGAAQR